MPALDRPQERPGLSGYYGYSRARVAGIPARMVIEAGFDSNSGERA